MARFKFNSASSHFELTAAGGLQQAPKAAKPVKKQYMMSARKSAPGTGGMPRRRRAKPGMRALREIVALQRTTDLIIPEARFSALVRESGQDYKIDLLWGAGSIDVIQEAAEAYIIKIMEAANNAAIHAKREMIMAKDVKLAIAMQDLLRGD